MKKCIVLCLLVSIALLLNAGVAAQAGAGSQQAFLKASNPGSSDRFGWSMAIDGDTLVVGAKNAPGNVRRAGAAYVFTRSGTSWTQEAILIASNGEHLDDFGYSVAIAGDTIVVGASGEDGSASGGETDNSAADSGAAYVFTRADTTWTPQARLKASNAGAGDRFGRTVGISGNTIVVGAPHEYSSATGVNGDQADNSLMDSGAAYVFTRTGTNWTQHAYVKASNTGRFDQFGFSVAISGDTFVVGAQEEGSSATGGQTDNTARGSGAAYVFTRTTTSWSQQAYLKASNAEAEDRFGWSVAIEGDTVAVGAFWEDGSATGGQTDNSTSQSGATYVFTRTETNWTQQAFLKASNADPSDVFGYSLALDGDGLVVAGLHESSSATGVNGDQADNSALWSGAAYLFTRTGTIWTQDAYLKASNTGTYDSFGHSVAIEGGTAVVGAMYEDTSSGNSGAAYVFAFNAPPVASAGPNVTIDSKNQAATTLAGTATDPDGDTLTYRWLEGTTVLAGPATPTGTACPLDLGTLSQLSIGMHTLTLEVTDGAELATDDMTLTIDNTAPVAAPVGGGVFEYGAANEVTLNGGVADFDGDTLTYEWRKTGSLTPIASGTIATTSGGAPVKLPEATLGTTALGLGIHAIELAVDDGVNAEVVATIEVEVADRTGPTLALECSQTILWPPNHKMVSVTVDPNATDEGGAVTIGASVASNEPVEGTGDGNTSPDWDDVEVDAVTGEVTMDLRAERSGHGNGRTYIVTITATDESGNVSMATCAVIVPQSKGKGK